MSFGRATRSGPVDAFGYACETKGKRKAGEALGLIPVLGSLAMAIGYTVVMGWIFKYMIGTFTGKTLAAASVEDFAGAFGSHGICLWKQFLADRSACDCNDHSGVRCWKGNREGQ